MTARRPLHTLDEVAEEFGVRREWLRRQVHAGVIPARKIAGKWRFTDADIDAALEHFSPANERPTTPPVDEDGVRQLAFSQTTRKRLKNAG